MTYVQVVHTFIDISGRAQKVKFRIKLSPMYSDVNIAQIIAKNLAAATPERRLNSKIHAVDVLFVVAGGTRSPDKYGALTFNEINSHEVFKVPPFSRGNNGDVTDMVKLAKDNNENMSTTMCVYYIMKYPQCWDRLKQKFVADNVNTIGTSPSAERDQFMINLFMGALRKIPDAHIKDWVRNMGQITNIQGLIKSFETYFFRNLDDNVEMLFNNNTNDAAIQKSIFSGGNITQEKIITKIVDYGTEQIPLIYVFNEMVASKHVPFMAYMKYFKVYDSLDCTPELYATWKTKTDTLKRDSVIFFFANGRRGSCHVNGNTAIFEYPRYYHADDTEIQKSLAPSSRTWTNGGGTGGGSSTNKNIIDFTIEQKDAAQYMHHFMYNMYRENFWPIVQPYDTYNNNNNKTNKIKLLCIQQLPIVRETPYFQPSIDDMMLTASMSSQQQRTIKVSIKFNSTGEAHQTNYVKHLICWIFQTVNTLRFDEYPLNSNFDPTMQQPQQKNRSSPHDNPKISFHKSSRWRQFKKTTLTKIQHAAQNGVEFEGDFYICSDEARPVLQRVNDKFVAEMSDYSKSAWAPDEDICSLKCAIRKDLSSPKQCRTQIWDDENVNPQYTDTTQVPMYIYKAINSPIKLFVLKNRFKTSFLRCVHKAYEQVVTNNNSLSYGQFVQQCERCKIDSGDKDGYYDSRKYAPCASAILGINIIVFVVVQQFPHGTIELPEFNQFYFDKYDKNKPTILIYKYDLAGTKKRVQYGYIKIIGTETEKKTMNNLVELVKNCYSCVGPSLNPRLEDKLVDIKAPMNSNFITKLLQQRIANDAHTIIQDCYGKTRGFVIQKNNVNITIKTPPVMLPYDSAKTYISDTNATQTTDTDALDAYITALYDDLNDEKYSLKIIGDTINIKSNDLCGSLAFPQHVSKKDTYENAINESNNNRRIAKCLMACIKWLFSVYLKNTKQQYQSAQNIYDKVDGFFKSHIVSGGNDYTYRLPTSHVITKYIRNDNVNDNVNDNDNDTITLRENDIAHFKTWLKQQVFNTPINNILQYSNTTLFIPDYIEYTSDFKNTPTSKVFDAHNIEAWILVKCTDPIMPNNVRTVKTADDIHTTLQHNNSTFKISSVKYPIFYVDLKQNFMHGPWFIIQHVQGGDFRRALNVSYYWHSRGINIGYDAPQISDEFIKELELTHRHYATTFAFDTNRYTNTLTRVEIPTMYRTLRKNNNYYALISDIDSNNVDRDEFSDEYGSFIMVSFGSDVEAAEQYSATYDPLLKYQFEKVPQTQRYLKTSSSATATTTDVIIDNNNNNNVPHPHLKILDCSRFTNNKPYFAAFLELKKYNT